MFINKRLAKALEEYRLDKNLHELSRPLFESQKGAYFYANTMCQLFLDIYKNLVLVMPQVIQDAELTLQEWPTKA